MRYKKIFLLVGVVLLGVGAWFFLYPSSAVSRCAFCDPSILQRQTFYEDDLVLALYAHKPIMPGHCLIIPRRHVERFEFLTKEEIAQMGEVIKKVSKAVEKVFHTSSYLLLQKNGAEAGQTVPHVHFHYIPKKEGDSSVVGFFLKMYLANSKGPISKENMCEIVQRLQQAME